MNVSFVESIRLVVALSLTAGFVFRAAAAFEGWGGRLLTDNENPANCDVLKDAEGNYIVFGTEGSWDGAHGKELIFDGNQDRNNNFFDPPSDAAYAGGSWAGIGFEKPKIVTKVGYIVRTNMRERMEGCWLQGANSSDFTDAETIFVFPYAASQDWNEHGVDNPLTTTFKAYKYFRLIGPNPLGDAPQTGTMCGNCTELYLWGFDAEELPSVEEVPPSDAPGVRYACRINGKVNFSIWGEVADAFYELQRRGADGEFVRVGTSAMLGRGDGWQAYVFEDTTPALVSYRVRAVNPNGASDWTEWTFPAEDYQLGAYIGTTSCWNGSGWYGWLAYDGNVESFADAGTEDAEAGNVWFGQDFGAEKTISKIRYVRRKDTDPGTMEGACFQVAADAEFTRDVQTIHTIPANPDQYQVVTVVLDPPVTTRFIRYHARPGCYGNVAEIEYSSNLSAVPAGLCATRTQRDLVLAWDPLVGGDARITGVKVFRRRFGADTWDVLGTLEATASSFIDRNVDFTAILQYALAYVSGGQNGAKCTPVFSGDIRQLERDPSNLAVLRQGVGVVWHGYPYRTDNTADMALKSFDGDVNTCCDLASDLTWENGTDVAVGVDFGPGQGYVLTTASACARNDPNWSRLTGAVIYGSNSETGDWFADAEPISAPFVVSRQGQWSEAVSTSAKAYRYMFIRQPSSQMAFWGNVAELRLFGFKPVLRGFSIFVR